jgi:predicted Zn-dependent protease
LFRVVFYFLLIVLLGRYADCGAANSAYSKIVGPTLCQKTLYLDSNFAMHDVLIIRSAAEEWEDATEGKVKFTIVENFDINNISRLDYNKDNIVVIDAEEDSPLLKKYDKHKSSYVLGYFATEYSVPMIILVPERMQSFGYYRAVAIHEMGHSIGLGHSKKEDTVMYPVIDFASWYVSESDLLEFCRNYYCKK